MTRPPTIAVLPNEAHHSLAGCHRHHHHLNINSDVFIFPLLSHLVNPALDNERTKASLLPPIPSSPAFIVTSWFFVFYLREINISKFVTPSFFIKYLSAFFLMRLMSRESSPPPPSALVLSTPPPQVVPPTYPVLPQINLAKV